MSGITSTTETLFTPFTINGLTVANRIAMAPMTREFSPDGVPGTDVAEYYARRAANSVGLIITEGTYVGDPPAGTSSRVPRFYGDEALDGWAQVAASVHREGGKIIPQLWHVGAARTPGAPPVADSPVHSPSGLGLDGSAIGAPMTQHDIDGAVRAFAEAAAAAERIGFDGIEVHGAHGYLVDQFLWERTNRRDDRYGGDPRSRVRFAADLVTACRAAVSPEFPIIFRTSQWKMENYEARIAGSPEELDSLLAPLVDAGVDAFHASTRRYWQPEFDDTDLNLAGWIKKITGRPTITVGSVGLNSEFTSSASWNGDPGFTSIGELGERLERGEFDLVAVGRALLADPHWALKIRQDRADEVPPFRKDTLHTLY